MRCWRVYVWAGLLAWVWGPVLALPTEAPLTRRDREIQRHLHAGVAAYADELYPSARRFFEQALRRAVTPAQVQESTLWLVRTLYHMNQYEELLDRLGEERLNASEDSLRHIYHYWRARAQYARGEYELAIEELNAVDPVYLEAPERAQRLRMFGRAYARTGRHESAARIFKSFDVQHSDDEDAGENILDWVVSLSAMGRVSETLDLLVALLDRYPDTDAAQTARLWLAGLYLEGDTTDKAREQLDELIRREQAPSDRLAEAWFAVAQIAERGGEYASAIRYLREGETAADTAAIRNRGRMLQARMHVAMTDVEKGISLLREVASAHPEHPVSAEAQLAMAEIMLERARYQEALDAFQNYLEVFDDPEGRARAMLGRAWSLLGLRRPLEAAASFEGAYALHPEVMVREEALFKLADSYFLTGEHQRAREEYLLLTQVYPGSDLMPMALFQAAECLARMQKSAEAVREFRAVEDAFPGSRYAERAAMRIGGLHEESGAWNRAIQTYNRLLATYPQGEWAADAIHRRGMIRYRLGLFAEALSDFERVVSVTPEAPIGEQAFYMRGWCWYVLGEDERALAVAEEFLNNYPDSEWAEEVLFWLGAYHFNAAAHVAAEQRFIQVADIYDAGGRADEALYWAGRAAMAQEEFLRAIDHFSLLARKYPESHWMPEVRFAQGDALSHLGEFAGAILAFDEVIRRYPDRELAAAAWGRKGDCQFTLGGENAGRFKEALTSYQALLEHPFASPAMQLQTIYKMGRCLEKLGEMDEALDTYLTVVYDFIADPLLRGTEAVTWFTRSAFTAATLQEASGNIDAAVNLLRHVVTAEVPASPDAVQRIERLQPSRVER